MGKKLEVASIGRTELLAVAKAMWEVQGLSARIIAENCGVSVGSIEKWKVKYNWMKKGNDADKVENLTRLKFMDLLSEQGMPPERAAKLLVEGMTKPQQDQIIDIDPKTKKPKVLFKGTPDYKARHKYHHDYLVMTGLIGNNKSLEVNNNGEGSVNIMVNLPPKD